VTDTSFEPTEPIPGLSYKAGEEYYAPGEWERRVDSKLKTLGLEIHVTAAGTVVLILGLALMGRSIVKVLQAQGQVFNILASAGLVTSQPTVADIPDETKAEVSDQGGRGASDAVSYAKPSGYVDTSSAAPVDSELLDELKHHVDQDPLRGGSEGPI
jgi:hypothetical protein